jgi:hypothetical protein
VTPKEHSVLILDQVRSHITAKFQWELLKNNIHLVYLPPNASGVLQPLDSVPFAKLSKAYTKAVHEFTPDGFTSITRVIFVQIYQKASDLALNGRNIRAG